MCAREKSWGEDPMVWSAIGLVERRRTVSMPARGREPHNDLRLAFFDLLQTVRSMNEHMLAGWWRGRLPG